MTRRNKIILITSIIIIGLIVYFIATAKKQVGGTTKSNAAKKSAASGSNKNTAAPVITDAQAAGIDISTPPTIIEYTTFNLGDKIYAGQDLLNTYKSCDIGTTTFLASYNKGDYIGNYIRTEGMCTVVSADTSLLLTSWFGNLSIPTGSTTAYIFENAQIFTKGEPYVQVAPIDPVTGCDANCNDPIGVSCKNTVGCP